MKKGPPFDAAGAVPARKTTVAEAVLDWGEAAQYVHLYHRASHPVHGPVSHLRLLWTWSAPSLAKAKKS